MAKTSAVQKNLKRIKMVKKYAKKRAALKKIINNRKILKNKFRKRNLVFGGWVSFAEIGITEMFRDLEQYRMIAFGGAMVLIMVFKPKGILANRKPTILMHGDKK